jgi:hypothetical protein
MDSNEKEGVCYAQPVTLDDRLRIACDFVHTCEYEIPIAVDPVDNPANELYAGWPERFYIVAADGTIAYKGETGPFGYHPDAVAAWLMGTFPRAVLPPAEVSADRIAKDLLAVRAVEYGDSRETWRLAIDPSSLATIGRGADAKSFPLDPERALALRRAIADRGFFGWQESTGWPNVNARTRVLAVRVGGDFKLVHRYSFADAELDPADEHAADIASFEALWDLVRGLDSPD